MPADGATVRSLTTYRLERRRASEQTERLPLALAAHPDAVSVLLGDELELWLDPDQADGLADDLKRLAVEARRG